MARGARWLVLPVVVFACTAATAVSGSATADREHKTGQVGAASPGRDTDRDGLSDDAERRNGTNPHKRDTDSDRLDDGAEQRHHTNPRKRDTDGDRLTDGAEVNRFRTNPRKRDTDGDGFDDNVELRGGTNPRNARSHLGFPDASNTGVPPGTVLTVHTSGSFNTSSNGQVIENLDMRNGCIIVMHYGVTVRNSKVRCILTEGSAAENPANPPLRVHDVDIVCDNSVSDRGMHDSNFIAERVDISVCENGFDINRNVIVRDSYLHDLGPTPVGEAHVDGLQASWGADSRIEHNTILSRDTSAIAWFNYDGNGTVPNWTITNNLLGAQTSASVAYLIYCPGGTSTNAFITNNRFKSQYAPVGGYSTGCNRPGITWSGNVIHETGAPLTPK